LSSSFEGVSKNAQQLPNWFYLIKRKIKKKKGKGEQQIFFFLLSSRKWTGLYLCMLSCSSKGECGILKGFHLSSKMDSRMVY
jgi:hypothetical protein